MAERSMRRLRERISEASSNRLVRALCRELGADVRRAIEDVLCQRLLDAVIPVLVRYYQVAPYDAEELALDAALVVICHPERYLPQRGASVETFARRIAVCDAINRRRKAERKDVQLVSLSDAEESELRYSADYGGETDEAVPPGSGAVGRFAEVYRSLSPRVQHVLQLRADDVEYQDVAMFTGMTAGAAMTAFSRARQRLAEALG